MRRTEDSLNNLFKKGEVFSGRPRIFNRQYPYLVHLVKSLLDAVEECRRKERTYLFDGFNTLPRSEFERLFIQPCFELYRQAVFHLENGGFDTREVQVSDDAHWLGFLSWLLCLQKYTSRAYLGIHFVETPIGAERVMTWLDLLDTGGV